MTGKILSEDAELICVIVNNGLGGKIISRAKEHGVLGGTIALGIGTATGKLVDVLSLRDVRKEVVFMIANKSLAWETLDRLHQVHDFDRPNHGIAFTTTVIGAVGSKWYRKLDGDRNENQKGEDVMHHIITTIVEKGKGEDVVEAATAAGSQGGTIINARGAGVHETQKVFGMSIEPEKEIVIIVSEKDKTEKILLAVHEKLEMKIPGHGIIYVQDVNKVYGV